MAGQDGKIQVQVEESKGNYKPFGWAVERNDDDDPVRVPVPVACHEIMMHFYGFSMFLCRVVQFFCRIMFRQCMYVDVTEPLCIPSCGLEWFKGTKEG